MVQIGIARKRASDISSSSGHGKSCGSYGRCDSMNERQKSSLCSLDPICTVTSPTFSRVVEGRQPSASAVKESAMRPPASPGRTSRKCRTVPPWARLFVRGGRRPNYRGAPSAGRRPRSGATVAWCCGPAPPTPRMLPMRLPVAAAFALFDRFMVLHGELADELRADCGALGPRAEPQRRRRTVRACFPYARERRPASASPLAGGTPRRRGRAGGDRAAGRRDRGAGVLTRCGAPRRGDRRRSGRAGRAALSRGLAG